MWRTAWLSMLALIVVTGCATSLGPVVTIPPFEGEEPPVVPEVDVAVATEAMRAVVNEEISGGSARSRFEALNRFMIDPQGLDFRYDRWRTSTAEQAFLDRRGNCVAFSNLYLSLARELGLQVHFQEARTLPEWQERDEAIVLGFHLNVAVRVAGRLHTVDADSTAAERVTDLRIVSDDRGAAHFYNNHAGEALLNDDLPLAYAYAHHALELAPETSFIWSNLGLVLARNGQLDDAVTAFERAVTLDARNLSAMTNLAKLLRHRGDLEAAARVDERVEARRRSDPYYWWLLGRRALAAGDAEQAVAYFKRAVARKPDDDRLRRALAEARAADRGTASATIPSEQAGTGPVSF